MLHKEENYCSMGLPEDCDSDETCEPPAKKYCIHPVVATESYGSKIIIKCVSEPNSNTHNNLNHELLRRTENVCTSMPPSIGLFPRRNVPSISQHILADQETSTNNNAQTSAVNFFKDMEESKTSLQNCESAHSYKTEDDKTPCEAMDTDEKKSDLKVPIIDIDNEVSPSDATVEQKQTLNVEHFLGKEDWQLKDFFDNLHLKKSLPTKAGEVDEGVENLVESFANDQNMFKVLQVFMSKMSSYPSANKFHLLLRTLLEGQYDEITRYSTFWYLKRILDVYPPNKKSRTYYYDVLFPDKNEFKWEEICEVIESCFHTPSAYGHKGCYDGKIHFLKIIVEILSKDFVNSHIKQYINIMPYHKQTFMCLLFFRPENSHHKKLQLLLKFINTAMNDEQFHLLETLMRLFYLLTETWRLAYVSHTSSLLSNSKVNVVTNEIFVHCRDILGDQKKVKIFLKLLSPLWLKIKVCETLLTRLISRTPLSMHCSELPTTLRKIVRQYIFPPCEKHTTTKDELDLESNNDDCRPLSVKQVMKPSRAGKGETMIHEECIRNRPEQLQEILRIPGIDINAPDFAGWTPLHECCIRGNLECAKLLVSWFPSNEKSVTVYTDHMTGANLCAAANNGVTPLHEAVSCNQTEIVRLLLEYGGPSLVNIKDKEKKTPHDYASNSLLAGVLDATGQDTTWKPKQRFDQESFFFEGDISYSKRLCPKFEDPAECYYYVYLLCILLKGYLNFTRLFALQKYAKMSSPAKGVKSVVNQFLIDCGGSPEFNDIVDCLDDSLVLQNLPEVLKTLSRQVTNADSSDETQELLLSLELLLCCL